MSEAQGAKRFGLTYRLKNEAALKACEAARQRLEAQGVETYTLDEVVEGAEADVFLSFGGDGTLLHAARLMAPRGIPVLGINLGRVGYLCALEESGVEPALEKLLTGRYQLDSRSMVRARVVHRREQLWQVDALNDVLVGGSTRTVTLEVHIDGELLGTLRGDGIIAATRTGSTAYALSAGGSVLLEDSLVLVASNALFSSFFRSLVVRLDATVRVVNRTEVARPYVIADGQKDYQIEDGTEVEIRRSPVSALLVDLGLESPVARLRRGHQERALTP